MGNYVDPRARPKYAVTYEDHRRVNYAALRGYEPVTISRVVSRNPATMEMVVALTDGVPVPRPGRRAPSVGHWRTSAGARSRPRPTVDARPTGGRVDASSMPGRRRRRKSAKPAATGPVQGAARFAAAWENRHNAT